MNNSFSSVNLFTCEVLVVVPGVLIEPEVTVNAVIAKMRSLFTNTSEVLILEREVLTLKFIISVLLFMT
jgi:hypothetical protein